jgi:hypothetical protein
MCFVHCLYITGPAISDYNKRLIQLTVIPLSGGHCIWFGCVLVDNVFIGKAGVEKRSSEKVVAPF